MESLPGYYMCHRVTYLLENSSAHKHKIILCVEVYHFDDLCYCRVKLPVCNQIILHSFVGNLIMAQPDMLGCQLKGIILEFTVASNPCLRQFRLSFIQSATVCVVSLVPPLPSFPLLAAP